MIINKDDFDASKHRKKDTLEQDVKLLKTKLVADNKDHWNKKGHPTQNVIQNFLGGIASILYKR